VRHAILPSPVLASTPRHEAGSGQHSRRIEIGMTPEEFDAFYAASFPRLVGQVFALCGNVTEANDCVQEAFVRAWDRRRALDLAQSPEAWVRTVAYRLAVSRWRRARHGRQLVDRSTEPDASREPVIDRIALAEALNRLPADQRRAIVLHHLCDLPVADVAAEVGVPVGTVKARLSRGRAALAALLRDGTTPRPVTG
jgi:RNA polymerase sigma-70 factor, ECF subfamily